LAPGINRRLRRGRQVTGDRIVLLQHLAAEISPNGGPVEDDLLRRLAPDIGADRLKQKACCLLAGGSNVGKLYTLSQLPTDVRRYQIEYPLIRLVVI
jgi:hypothetical protein